MAAYALKGPLSLRHICCETKETWTQKKILMEIKKGKRQVVMLPEPVNVHVLYGTAWVDHYGVLQFRNDIYHTDGISYDIPIGRVVARPE